MTRVKWKLVGLKIVLMLRQYRCTVCVERTIGSEIVLDTLNSKVTWVIWNLASFRLETVLVSGQDRCMVWGDEALVEARFSPFGDSANLDAR